MSISEHTKLGVVTVYDAKIYTLDATDWSGKTPTEILALYDAPTPLAEIKSLKTANLVQSGPEISIQGGSRNDVLIKHGKSARCEMQDVLANTKALIALGALEEGDLKELHTTEKFGAPVTIIGDTFLINSDTGAEEAHKIIIFKFLPDSIFNLNQDAAAAAVFDMNGDMQAVEIKGAANGDTLAFYSIY